jgi:hypothetical protein
VIAASILPRRWSLVRHGIVILGAGYRVLELNPPTSASWQSLTACTLFLAATDAHAGRWPSAAPRTDYPKYETKTPHLQRDDGNKF